MWGQGHVAMGALLLSDKQNMENVYVVKKSSEFKKIGMRSWK
jgi:hypothetical protein